MTSLAILGASLGASLGPAAAAGCADPAETRAAQVRALQSRLMVGALVCNVRAKYNDFVVKYRPELKRNGTRLISYFDRSYGGDAERRLNSFVTALANEASTDSNADRGAFCSSTAALLAELDRNPGTTLASLPLSNLVSVPMSVGFSDCQTARR